MIHEETRKNLKSILEGAGLTGLHFKDKYQGLIGFFDLIENPSMKYMQSIVDYVKDNIAGIEVECFLGNSFYISFNNGENSYGELGILFSEFPGSQLEQRFAYLKGKGLISIAYQELEPRMRNDERYLIQTPKAIIA